jgi:hypothetical protein
MYEAEHAHNVLLESLPTPFTIIAKPNNPKEGCSAHDRDLLWSMPVSRKVAECSPKL